MDVSFFPISLEYVSWFVVVNGKYKRKAEKIFFSEKKYIGCTVCLGDKMNYMNKALLLNCCDEPLNTLCTPNVLFTK